MNRVSRKISAIYTGFLFAISISIFIVLITVLLLHYEDLIHWIIQKLRNPELEVLLRNKVLTPAKFHIAQNISLAGLIALPLLVFVFIKMKNRLLQRIFFLLQIFRGAFSSWNKVFGSQSRLEKISFYTALLLISVRSIFYILTRDLQYDEMWCYNYYTASPFYFSFILYNNYPLYEISTHLFNWLPFSGKINIRLPVFIAGLGACSVLYFYLLKFFKNPFPALAAMILFAFLPPVTSYMFYGPEWLGNFSYFITGFPLGLSVVLVLGLAMIIIPGSFSRFQKPILFSCLLCILPAIINLLQRINSHFRVLTFIELAPVLMLAIILQVFGSSLNKKYNTRFVSCWPYQVP